VKLQLLDWLIVAGYLAATIGVGLALRKRAGKSVEDYFLSGRSLPWWLVGTSMVATSFAADTPLVISGWVRDHGIWKNWLWWCYALSALLGTFLFARWWRRGEVTTKAELSELRYGGAGARALRGTLGVMHAGITNVMVLCWVLLAAAKILGVLLGVDKFAALLLACGIALVYSMLAGFWGVVVTDFFQFAISLGGAVLLAALAWKGAGGAEGLVAAAGEWGSADTLRFLPAAGPGSPWEASFWTTSVAALAVYLGVAWWAVESIDGSGTTVQRVSASRDEREGVLAVLWYTIAHHALRPWPWILVGLASLAILPPLRVASPVAGTVQSVSAAEVVIAPADGGPPRAVALELEHSAEDWQAGPVVAPDEQVARGQLIARSDAESAYVVMLARLLPVGLLGLVVASLIAAFMSTIDTHVNLAASFFVNDVYRRFIAPDRSEAHQVLVSRITSAVVLLFAAAVAWQSDSISDLFVFFLAFLSGVGPVYLMRWLWWRVRASTEITALVASGVSATLLTHVALPWPETVLTPGGVLGSEARIVMVVFVSLIASLVSMALTRRPEPAELVDFYRKVRPLGWWAPVRELAPGVEPDGSIGTAMAGVLSGLALVFGILFATGHALLGRPGAALGLGLLAAAGGLGVAWALKRMEQPAGEES
jgi:Na+/proline symporter